MFYDYKSSTTSACDWCGIQVDVSSDFKPDDELLWCGQCNMKMSKCSTCGKPAVHEYRSLLHIEPRCCFCHVLSDKAEPADWHPACMKALALLKRREAT